MTSIRPEIALARAAAWLIYRPGSPDLSRPSPAIHHDDPSQDRDRSRWLGAPIPIAPEHRGLPLEEIVRLPAYAPPIMPAGHDKTEA